MAVFLLVMASAAVLAGLIGLVAGGMPRTRGAASRPHAMRSHLASELTTTVLGEEQR
jgi:hypothetical protein